MLVTYFTKFRLNFESEKETNHDESSCPRTKLNLLLSLFMGLELASQRELISIFNTDIYSGEDVYSAGVYNNWTGSYQINLPKPEKVERIVVEAAFESESENCLIIKLDFLPIMMMYSFDYPRKNIMHLLRKTSMFIALI